METITGIAASRGIAIGPAQKILKQALQIEETSIEDPDQEIVRLHQAIQRAQDQLKGAYQKALAEIGPEEAAIFEAHALILDDPELLGSVEQDIRDRKINAEAALKTRSESYAQKLEGLDNEYFRERAADIRDVIDRTLRIMTETAESGARTLRVPAVILADDLTPSDTIQLDKSLVLGFCTAQGGSTSHTAILARGLGIPAVVGAGPEILDIPDQAELIVDGTRGEVLIDAPSETLNDYRTKHRILEQAFQEANQKSHLPAVTRDDHQVEIAANIGDTADLKHALENGAEGVGLLRTEFVYLGRDSLPDEHQQVEIYRQILAGFGDQPVILRTLDIGGDKELPYLQLAKEDNPFLGVRAIRLSFQNLPVFKTQLRAALQAGAVGRLKVMFPMISSLQEIQKAKGILVDCQEELKAEGLPSAENLSLGIMIEIPSAALMVDQLVHEVDFFSIGTNDLSQYTYAADRVNKEVAQLASGYQPAVLRLIARVIETAHKHQKWVGCCGELAGEPLAIPILIGLGIDELSMNPPAIPFAKQLIRTLNYQELQATARTALDQIGPNEVKELIWERVPEVRSFLDENSPPNPKARTA